MSTRHKVGAKKVTGDRDEGGAAAGGESTQRGRPDDEAGFRRRLDTEAQALRKQQHLLDAIEGDGGSVGEVVRSIDKSVRKHLGH